ncbi:MAG: ubiquinone/menaquinone biosynthesis methyltransferase, partial [Armatimonadota bacterium]
MHSPPREITTDAARQIGTEAYIENLFSSIAPRYDLINTLLSLTRHKAWRRFAVEKSGVSAGGRALDVCCGTGDFAFELARVVGPTGRVVAIDFSAPMLNIAEKKARERGFHQVEFREANACRLPFADSSFDCATIGFGLRNVPSIESVLREMTRVVRPQGRVVSLEILGIRSWPAATFWRLYFDFLAPHAARLLGGRREAYEYL